MKWPRGTPRQDHRLQLVTGQGTTESPRTGRLRAVGSQSAADIKRVTERTLPAMPETAANRVHVLVVSLHGAAPPSWRRLEVPSAITLEAVNEFRQC